MSIDKTEFMDWSKRLQEQAFSVSCYDKSQVRRNYTTKEADILESEINEGLNQEGVRDRILKSSNKKTLRKHLDNVWFHHDDLTLDFLEYYLSDRYKNTPVSVLTEQMKSGNEVDVVIQENGVDCGYIEVKRVVSTGNLKENIEIFSNKSWNTHKSNNYLILYFPVIKDNTATKNLVTGYNVLSNLSEWRPNHMNLWTIQAPVSIRESENGALLETYRNIEQNLL